MVHESLIVVKSQVFAVYKLQMQRSIFFFPVYLNIEPIFQLDTS